MGTISITFRVPVCDLSTGAGPFTCARVDDGHCGTPGRRNGCGHRHRSKRTAEKCARSLSLGQTGGAVSERIEITDIAEAAG